MALDHRSHWALGILGHCVYQFKKGEPKEDQSKEGAHKFEME